MSMLRLTTEFVYNGEVVGYRFEGNKKKYDMSYNYLEEFLNDIGEFSLSQNIRTENVYLHNGQLMTYTEKKSGKTAIDIEDIGYINFLRIYNKSWQGDSVYEEKHRMFNDWYFNGELNDIHVFRNTTSKTCGGYFKYNGTEGIASNRAYIEICSLYVEKYPEELDSILQHEMIHQYLYEKGYDETHGVRFQHKMRELNREYGLSISLTSRHASPSPYKQLLECNRCHALHKGRRRTDTNKYKCSCGGKLVENYLGDFYAVTTCRACKKLLIATEFEDLGKVLECPYCGNDVKLRNS